MDYSGDALRAWSYRQQMFGRGSGPGEVLAQLVSVYSSHPTAPLALLGRCPDLDADAFRALEERREAVRIPAMRTSIFLAPTPAAAPLFSATRIVMSKLTPRLYYAGVSWDQYTVLKDRLLEATQEPVSAGELSAVLDTDAKVATVLRVMSYEGLILRLGTSLRSDNLRYVATKAWLGSAFEELDQGAATQWLAEAYLRGYGPARVEDFAWWSGVPRRRAVAALRPLATVDIGGGLLLLKDQREAFEQVEPVDPAVVDVLPKWDAYTMGYAPDGRQRLVEDRYLSRAYSTAGVGGAGATSGDGLPLILRGGQAVGTWAHRLEGSRLRVTLTPFVSDPTLAAACQAAFERIGQLLAVRAVDLTVVDPG